MSGQDIIDDLGVTEIDIDFAEQSGKIIRCNPLPGGISPWYCLP